ncbi:MAG TPA: adenylate/guanylate cyclase domain-containing protein [Candidatus Limnocylindria bacterium]|nr:adenylate/guanylate cyclase domain-containing protein [Candidatus Limnocylindria bacterium]
MPDAPRTTFARNGEVHIAFQVVGSGSPDLLLVDTWVHHVEAVWDFPDFARLLRRLSAIGRLIHFDRRGTGLSDPVPLDRLPDLDTQVEDAVAVLDAAGSAEAVVIGMNDGVVIASLLAAAHPERCRSLVVFPGAVRHSLAGGMPMPAIDAVVRQMTTDLAAGKVLLEMVAPSRVGDERFEEHLARLQRFALRPGAVGHYFRQTLETDVGPALHAIQAPTLVLNRTGNRIVPLELSREAAALIPGAKLVELPGSDHLAYSEGVDAVADEIEEFVTGARSGVDAERMLATLLFTDIVGSTSKAAELGDRRWRDLLEEHHRLVRTELVRFKGRELGTAGDGFFATFDAPGAAIRCAIAIVAAAPRLGLGIRTGIHTGEVEVRGPSLGGMAVHIAARVASVAGEGEVLVSQTVRDLVAGSSFAFEDRGEHSLKGVPGSWRLFAARTG